MNRDKKEIKKTFFYPLIIFMIILSNAAFANSHQVNTMSSKILFVFYDAGETYALLPVMKELAYRNFEVKAFAFGNGSQHAIKGTNFTLDIPTHCKLKNFTPGDQIKRNIDWSPEDVKAITECYAPDVVVLGMVSHIQRQLAQVYFKEKKVPTIGYYNGFATDQEPFIYTFQPYLTKLLVAANTVRDAFLKHKFLATSISLVGQPALEEWIQEAQKYSQSGMRAKLMGERAEKSKVVLFIGGYKEGYLNIFEDFLLTCANLSSKAKCYVSVHPSQTGELEQKIIQKYKACNDIEIINHKKYSTLEAVIASDVIVSQGSTVGIQARFLGKETIFLT
ncbi:MAG: hypothetical protein K2X39_03300 [Silvanigrellaceae bacterium]|nr:hypothetical protein [Silvanigrellaceae bacterium]